jgi:hypothetical protein
MATPEYEYDTFYEDLAILRSLVAKIFHALPDIDWEESAAFAAAGAMRGTVEALNPVSRIQPRDIDFDAISRPAKEAVAQGVSCLG